MIKRAGIISRSLTDPFPLSLDSAAIRSDLRVYLPSNRALDWLRSPRGLE